MKLFVEFFSDLSNQQVSDKIKEIATLIDDGFTEGMNIPEETEWKFYVQENSKQKAIAGSKINNQ